MPGRRPATSEAERGGRSLRQAVVTALLLLGLIAVAYTLGRTAFFVVAATVVLLALYELLDALVRTGRRPVRVFGLACALALLATAYAQAPRYLAAVLALTMFGALLLALRPNRGPAAGSDAAWTTMAVFWIGGGGAGAVSILMLRDGVSLLVAFVLTTALSDIGAYFVGTSYGKHKLAPSISPGKSWEGFVGGLVCALAGGAAFAGLLPALAIDEGVGVGLICGLLAPVGDLVESLVKREIGIKDSGHLLPGHGGFLDRLDAILFCAPAAFFYLEVVLG